MTETKSIIGCDEWKEMLGCVAARQPRHATSTERDRFRALLSPWQIDAICRFVPLPNTEAIRMHFHGTAVSGQAYRDSADRLVHTAVRELLESGASLSMSCMENYSGAVLRLSRSLEAEVGGMVQVNVYQTPAGGQGLGSHVDKHDVMVLQLAGEKDWQIAAADPTDRAAAGRSSPAGAALLRATVRAGDWLYLPRGTRHEVRNAGSEASLHLTVGFHPVTEGAIAGTDGRPRTVRALGVRIPAAVVTRNDLLGAADAESRFAWRAEVALVRATDRLELDCAYRRAPLSLHPDLAPSVERMAHASSFRPCDLDGDDLETATELARLLAGAGILQLR